MSKELTKKIKLSRTLLPLLQATIKNRDLNLLSLYEEVDDSANKIIEGIKESSDFDKKELYNVKCELYEILSPLLSYEVIYNKNRYLEEVVESLIELFEIQKDFFKNNSNDEVNDISIFYAMNNIFTEINKFHSLLYFSGYVNYNDVKDLNNEVLKNANKNIGSLISYLKKSGFNDNSYIYDIIKIATIIYADILEGLFVNLSKNEKKMNEYIMNQKSYIAKIEELFIEQYSLLNSSCINLNKKLNIEK